MGRIRRARDIDGEEEMTHMDVRLGGRERHAHVLIDVLGGERARVTIDGKVFTADA